MDINLRLISDVYDFIDITQKHPSKVRLSQGGYTVDGKSIMGIFALDLRNPINCDVEDGNYSEFERFVNKL